MKSSSYELTLNIHEAISKDALYVKQGDTVRRISVSLADGGNPYELASDCSAALCAVLPSGETKRLAMDIYHNQLHATIPDEWVATAGEIKCEAQVIGSNPSTRLTSPTFSVIVTEALSILGPENFAYWYKGTNPTTSTTRRIPITDANFEFDFPEETNAYNGWVLIPKSLYPDDGVYICSTGGIVFPYDSEKSISVGSGEYVTFKCFKSPSTFSAHQYVVVREREES